MYLDHIYIYVCVYVHSRNMCVFNLTMCCCSSQVHSFVRFVNKSVRVVELRWVDYEGEHTPFKVIHPTLFVDVNTFVGHPWTVCDAVTVDRMVFDGKQVFEPVPFQLGDDQLPLRNTVNISLPGAFFGFFRALFQTINSLNAVCLWVSFV